MSSTRSRGSEIPEATSETKQETLPKPPLLPRRFENRSFVIDFLNILDVIEGIKDNHEFNVQAQKVRASPQVFRSSRQLSDEEIESINAMAEPVGAMLSVRAGRAKEKIEVRMDMGYVDGQLMVLSVALTTQGAAMASAPGTEIVVHWHFSSGDTIPSELDDQPARANGLSVAVITFYEAGKDRRCCKVWEVATDSSGASQYREITDNKVGEWNTRKGW